MKKFLAIFSVMFLVSGCVSNSTPKPSTNKYKGVTEEQAAENRDRPYREGMESLEVYMSETECDTKSANTIKRHISNLETQIKTWDSLKSIDYIYKRRAEASKNQHRELAFGFADESLKRECLDNADTTYRSLVNFYIGGAYVGIRDRAKIGIDDVRSAKKK